MDGVKVIDDVKMCRATRVSKSQKARKEWSCVRKINEHPLISIKMALLLALTIYV